jgi:YfiH family protein
LCYIERLGQGAFKIVARDGLRWLECGTWARFSWLRHAFSTRCGGVSEGPAAGLNLGFVGADGRANVEENRRSFFAALGAEGYSLAALRQGHSTHIYQVVRRASGELECRPAGFPAPSPTGHLLPVGDALLTNEPGILLTVRTADCLPILVLDPRRHAVAAIHAGWRSALGRIIEKTVGVMRAVFGSDPQHLLAALGPSIRACCYEVGEEVVAAFCGRFAEGERFFRQESRKNAAAGLATRHAQRFLSAQPPGRSARPAPTAHLDLVAVAQDQLCRAGLRPCQVQVARFCTACRTDLFFSHRKEGKNTGRTMAVIGIRPGAGH